MVVGGRSNNSDRDNGGVIVFPTDTVYGMGCDPYDKNAVERIYKIKSRDASKPLPVLADSIRAAERISCFDEYSKRIASKYWPGSLTMILGLTDTRLSESMHLANRIAVRIPNNPCTLALLKECGSLLVGTSANMSGNPSFADPAKCPEYIKNSCDLFVDGGITAQGSESTIIDVVAGVGKFKIIRQGACILDDREVYKP